MRREEAVVSFSGQALIWGESSSQQGAAPGHRLPHHISSFSSTSDFHTLPGLAHSHAACSCPHPIPHLPPLPGRSARNWSRCVGPPPPRCRALWYPAPPSSGRLAGASTPAQTEGGLDLILGAGKGPDLVTTACAKHGQEPGSVGTLAPWTFPPHRAERVGRARRDEASWKGLSRNCFAPSSWQ